MKNDCGKCRQVYMGIHPKSGTISVVDDQCQQFKFCNSGLLSSSLFYISDLLIGYSPIRSLRSSSMCLLNVPRIKSKFGHLVTMVLPVDLRSAVTVSSFKSRLSTLLFSQAIGSLCVCGRCSRNRGYKKWLCVCVVWVAESILYMCFLSLYYLFFVIL